MLAACTGCTGSRWGRSHPSYAAKYPRHTGNLARMAKQAVDARHVAGETGLYSGVSGRDEPAGGAVHLGGFHYPEYLNGAVETRLGIQGVGVPNKDFFSGGFECGARLQSPSRLAPFVGIGGYAGGNEKDDGRDNNGNGYIDEDFEKNDTSYDVAVIPEVGVHFWTTPYIRTSASASYYVTSAGGDSDFMLYGVSLSVLTKPKSPAYTDPSEFCPIDCGDATDSSGLFPGELYPSEPWPQADSTEPPLNPAYEGLLDP
ncbi:hypothetical protein Pla123a_02990 [Posidoniimonas polymericola]|uniref:Outer membrane protein beta-barrel domain-containing protein n=1 Tax=Posidoniimonas polymericola TaxID=2528002 RepID=A0A5C5ZDU0_9BACT|nr:hypothetical protein [Posidoniimonas polymericola]TWT85492.1 hypothetical protein Pla123a_02990 [Posidoniimonas polymericola]